MKRVAEHLGVAYLGVTRETLNVEDEDMLQQFLLWLQIEVQEGEGPVHLGLAFHGHPGAPGNEWLLLSMGIHTRTNWKSVVIILGPWFIAFMRQRKLINCLVVDQSLLNSDWSRNSEGWNDPTVVQTM